MPEPGASAFGCSGFPAWILIDTTALIGHCDNETTARGTARDGSPIEVSFVVVDPPALSRCFVYCPDLTASNSASTASVTGADGAFLLIRVFFSQRDGKRHFSDVFVYRAGSPSLLRIPEPYPVYFLSRCVGVLTCGDAREHCLAVVPAQRFDADGRMRYDLRVFSTMTKLWSTKVARVPCESEMHYGLFEPSKVLSIGGVSLAWVDLRYGILLCKQVEKDPVMRLIELPALLSTNVARFGVRSDDCIPPLDWIRDVTFSNGWFRFVELEFVGSSTLPSWRVTVFMRKMESENWQWFNVVDIPSFDSVAKLTISSISYPTLDVYNGSIVFMIAKRKASDLEGWVLAVNTESKTLFKRVPFYAERLYSHCFYLQCAFSKHLTKASGTHASNELKGTFSRGDQLPLVLSTVSVLDVKQKLTHIVKKLSNQGPCYNEVCSLRNFGPGSTLRLDIQRLAQYAVSNGLGKAGYDAVTLINQVSDEIDNYCKDPSACDEALIETVNVAVGALENLLQVVPSDVLDTGRIMLSVARVDKESVDEVSIADKFASQSLTYACTDKELDEVSSADKFASQSATYAC